jgi:acyl carrier protein phosphodiesterase
MNFLAHAHLSFGDPETTVGNLISDFVKGRRQHDFPEGIRRGIRLHREIDRFTDEHPATREAKAFFHKDYRLYSSAFVDIVYDHFLAADIDTFPEEALRRFADGTYAHLERHGAWLPERFAGMFPYMKSQDWLFNYRYRWGIEMSFKGLVRRAAYLNDSSAAMRVLEAHHDELQSCYRTFMPEVRSFAESRFSDWRPSDA